MQLFFSWFHNDIVKNCCQRFAAMSSCGQDSRVFSATANEVNEIEVSFDTIAAISHDGC